MKVYITKHALTKGIMEKEAEICDNVSKDMIKITTNHYPEYYHKPFWYTDKQEAIKHAENMCKKKIASLKKSIEKLEKLNF